MPGSSNTLPDGLDSTPPRSGVILSDVGDISGATQGILSVDPILDSEFYQKYIRISKNPASVNIGIFHMGFDLDSFQTELSQYIDKIYGCGYYFDGLDVATLELFLYGTLEEIKSKLPEEEGILRVADMIKKVPIPSNVLTAIYDGEIRFSDRDKTQASYFPKNSISKIYQMIGENNMNNEEYTKMKRDYFHAFFWNNYRIKYHGVSMFLGSIDGKGRDTLDDILSKEEGRIISAKRSKTPTIHEKLEWNRLSKRNLSHPIGADGKIDLTKPACVFPQAQKGDWVIEVVYGKLGIAGVRPDGSREDPEPIKKINLVNILHNMKNPRIDIVEIHKQGCTRIIAGEDIFIIKVGNKIDFSEKMKYVGNIGGSGNMGSFHVPDNTEFILQGDVKKGYSISAYSFVYYGELCGEIKAKKDVHVVRGSILGGEIGSLDGNIIVDTGARIQNNSSLTALNGAITIADNVENTVIMGDEINILGTATNCIIIGRKVSVGTNNGSKIMAESMKIGKDISPEISEYTLLLYASTERIIALAKQKQEAAEGEINKIKDRESWLKKQFTSLDKSDSRRKDIVQEGALLRKRLENITQDREKTKEISSFFDGNEVLFTGPSVRLVIERSPFFMSNALHSLISRQDELPLREKQKTDGYSALANRLAIGDNQIVYTGNNYTRGAILESLKSNSVDLLRSDSERVVVYNRMQLSVKAEGIVGSLYDYSDEGCAFVLRKSKTDPEFNVARKDHINLTIMDKAQSFIVARVDSDFMIGGEVFYKIAGSFEKKGVGKEIGIEIMSREQAKNSK